MKRHFKIVIALMAVLMACTGLQAKKKNPFKEPKPFYDSKSWIVNVAGDYEILQNAGLYSKVNPVQMNLPTLPNGIYNQEQGEEMARILTKEGYGKKMIDAITNYGTSDALLQKMALANAQRSDFEMGAASIRAVGPDGIATLIADDYEPILTHNYMILDYPYTWKDSNGKTFTRHQYSIFKVDVDPQTALDIVSSITDPERYNAIECPVQFMYTLQNNLDFEKELAKYVPDMALRGVLLHRAPCKISIGTDAGLKKGDLVTFYSQRIDKKGNPYSKKISRARVGGIWENEAQVNYEAGTSGNRKNGDIVVRTPDSHERFVLAANWTPHVWGGHIMLDCKTGFTRSGLIHHFLMDLGFNMTDKPGNAFFRVTHSKELDRNDQYVVVSKVIDNTDYKAPIYMNLGLGYGISKTFLGFFDVMPFFLVQYEPAIMFEKMKLADASFNPSAPTNYGMPFANTLRVPIGVRFSFNIGYPTRLFLEGGYAARAGFGDDYKIVKDAEKYIGAKRDGIFLNVGIQF